MPLRTYEDGGRNTVGTLARHNHPHTVAVDSAMHHPLGFLLGLGALAVGFGVTRAVRAVRRRPS